MCFGELKVAGSKRNRVRRRLEVFYRESIVVFIRGIARAHRMSVIVDCLDAIDFRRETCIGPRVPGPGASGECKEQGTGAAAEGGAIYSSGTLTLGGVTVQSNRAVGSAGADATRVGQAGGTGASAYGA